MKLIALSSAVLLAATTAFAGNATFTPEPNLPVEITTTPPTQQGSSGGSAGWIVPLVAIALVGLAVYASNKDDK